MINFGGLQDLITNVTSKQEDMAVTLARLETTMATLASKLDLDNESAKLKETLGKHDRLLERLDVAQRSAAQIIDEMPTIQRELTTRMSDLEQRLGGELSTVSQSLGGRVAHVESELRNKASGSELRKMSNELDDRAKREDLRNVQDLVNKVRDEASDRIDDIGERTFNMRRELDASLDGMQREAEAMQERVEERTNRLEEQSSQVSTFLAKSERQIQSKVRTPRDARRETRAAARAPSPSRLAPPQTATPPSNPHLHTPPSACSAPPFPALTTHLPPRLPTGGARRALPRAALLLRAAAGVPQRAAGADDGGAREG